MDLAVSCPFSVVVDQPNGELEPVKLEVESVAGGLTTKAIGGELWISEHTVKFHLTNIYRKLRVANRSGAVRYAIENGLATPMRAGRGGAREAIGR